MWHSRRQIDTDSVIPPSCLSLLLGVLYACLYICRCVTVSPLGSSTRVDLERSVIFSFWDGSGFTSIRSHFSLFVVFCTTNKQLKTPVITLFREHFEWAADIIICELWLYCIHVLWSSALMAIVLSDRLPCIMANKYNLVASTFHSVVTAHVVRLLLLLLSSSLSSSSS